MAAGKSTYFEVATAKVRNGRWRAVAAGKSTYFEVAGVKVRNRRYVAGVKTAKPCEVKAAAPSRK